MPADTLKRFESDPYLKEFETLITATDALPQGQGVVLEETCFYPEGGGQPCDHGTLNGFPVRSVTESEGRIVHVTEGASLKLPAASGGEASICSEETSDIRSLTPRQAAGNALAVRFKPGEKVRGVLDWARRFDHMQQHSGQHLLSQAFVRVLQADTVSFHLGSDESTIDVTIPDLTDRTVSDVEQEANRIVFENRPLRISVRSAADLDSIPLRKKPDLTGDVRLIEIADYDWSLCCGTHVRATGEIGLIKILQWEKYKAGTRVHFACGGRSLHDYQSKSGLVKSLSRLLTAGEAEIESIVTKLRDDKKASEKRIAALLDETLAAEASRMISAAPSSGSFRLVSSLFRDRDAAEVQLLCRKIIASGGTIAVIGTVLDRVTIYFGRSEDVKADMREIQKAAAGILNGKGGGSPAWAQCSSDRTDLAEEAVAKAVDLLKS